MTILDALRLANSEHVVYFLLTAYVETLHYCGEAQFAVPPHVTKLPLSGKSDVMARLRAFSRAARDAERHPPAMRCVIEEAAEIFAAASRRLSVVTVQRVIPLPLSSALTPRDAWIQRGAASVLPAGPLAAAVIESRYGERASRNRRLGKRTRFLYGRRRIRSEAR